MCATNVTKANLPTLVIINKSMDKLVETNLEKKPTYFVIYKVHISNCIQRS